MDDNNVLGINPEELDQLSYNDPDSQFADNGDVVFDDYNPDNTEPAQPDTSVGQTQPDVTQVLLEKIAALEQRLAQLGQPQQQVIQEPVEDVLQPPKPPEKPENYNELEAYNDPNSESWKYRKAKEKYMEDLLAYNQKLEQMRQAELQKLQMERMIQMKTQQALSEVSKELVTKYKFTQSEVVDFINTMSRPETLSLDTLVAFYKTLKSGSRQTSVPRQSPPSPIQGGASNTNNLDAMFVEMLKKKK